MMDYLRLVAEADPIPGVEIKVITYDTQSNPGRIPVGYQWLKGQGAAAMSCSPIDFELVMDNAAADHIPFIGLSNVLSTLQNDWQFSTMGPVDSEIEVLLQWVMDGWQGYPTKPKIGFVGLAGVPFFQGQLNMAQTVCGQHPDKLEWLGAQMAPTTTTSWAIEVSRLMSSDFIIVALSGPPLASFTREAINRGYKNRFIGPYETYRGFWPLLAASVPLADLDGTVTAAYAPWYDENVPYISEIKEYMQEHLSPGQIEATYLDFGRIHGWAHGMVLVDTVRRAVQKVGAANVDGSALRDALAETNIDMAAVGWGNPWKITGKAHCFAQTIKVYEYKASSNSMTAVSSWIRPASLED